MSNVRAAPKKAPGLWVRLAPDLRAWIEHHAPQERRTKSSMAETLIAEAIERREMLLAKYRAGRPSVGHEPGC